MQASSFRAQSVPLSCGSSSQTHLESHWRRLLRCSETQVCANHSLRLSELHANLKPDLVASYMRDIEITDDELDQVGGFGTEKSSKGTLEIEKAAQGLDTNSDKNV